MSLHTRHEVRVELDQAAMHMEAGLLAQARTHLTQALRLDPSSIEGRILEARLALRHHKPTDAMRALSIADQYEPTGRDDLDRSLLRATALVQAEQHVLARPLLDRLIDACPEEPRFHRLAAVCTEAFGDTAAAIAHLRTLCRLQPQDASARRTLVRLLGRQDPQAAIDLLLRQGDAISDEARTEAYEAARLLRRTGRLREADEALQRLIEHSPDDVPLRLEAGAVADELGAIDAAVAHVTDATRLSHDGSARAALARVLMHAGRFAEAGRHWWCLRHAADRGPEALAGLLACALACDRPRLAAKVRNRLRQQVARPIARQLACRQWLHAAVSLVDVSADEPACDTQAVSPLAGLLDRAERTLDAHAHAHPGRADAWFRLAVVHQAQGRPDEACAAVDQALALNPHYFQARQLQQHLAAPDRAAA